MCAGLGSIHLILIDFTLYKVVSGSCDKSRDNERLVDMSVRLLLATDGSWVC